MKRCDLKRNYREERCLERSPLSRAALAVRDVSQREMADADSNDRQDAQPERHAHASHPRWHDASFQRAFRLSDSS
jgi:hypothetical protein